MSLANLKTVEGVQGEKDSVGFKGPVPSQLYPCTVKMAYMGLSKGGAQCVNLHLETSDGQELRFAGTFGAIYVTSGNEKGNKTTFTKNGKTSYLPGFNLMNSLALLTVGKDLGDLTAEDKVVNIYDFEQKKELPTTVPVLTELLGKEVIAGVVLRLDNKGVKQDNGMYVDGPETRQSNELDKFFRATDKLTTAEILAQSTEANFYTTWGDRWIGQEKDERSIKDGVAPVGGNVAAIGVTTAAAKPTKSLFATP